jgi:hypothetical protein
MDKIFKYCILQYVHSQLLAERLNVGILFYFPSQGQLVFRSFQRLRKFKWLYPAFPTEGVIKYLKEFERGAKVNGRLIQSISQEDFDHVLEKNLLTVESAPFQFSPVKTAVLYSTSIDKIISDYCHIYERDSEKEVDLFKSQQKKESPIRKFKDYLENSLPEIKTQLLPTNPIRIDKVTFKPDLVWQNGSTNLVKEIVFPKTEENLLDRALLLNRKADYFIDTARANKYRFDFLVQKPLDENLEAPYQNALDILNEIRAPKKIITENELESYAKNAVDDIKKHL